MQFNTNLAQEAITLTKWLISIPSVAHAKGPALISQAIYDGLKEFPYFKNHPEYLFLQEHTTSEKSSVVALVKGIADVQDTLVLLCHSDTTSPYHYGMLKGLSTNSDNLRQRLLELCGAPLGDNNAIVALGAPQAHTKKDDTYAAEERSYKLNVGSNAVLTAALKRALAREDALLGLGVLENKCATGSMLVALKELSDNSVQLNLNILFICTSESLLAHQGIKSTLQFIRDLCNKEHLKLRLALNAQPNLPQEHGDNKLHLYTGNYGKVEPSFYIIGNSATAYRPYEGFSASIIAAELIRQLELNPKLLAHLQHRPLVPTFDSLRVKEFGKNFTPDGMQVSFNLPVGNVNLADLLEVLKEIAATAIENAADLVEVREAHFAKLRHEDYVPSAKDAEVVSFSDLLDRASHNFKGNLRKALQSMVQKCLNEGLSLHQASITIIERLNELAQLPRPSIVVYYTDNYVPTQGLSANLSQDRELFMILDGLLQHLPKDSPLVPVMGAYYGATDANFLRPEHTTEALETIAQECPLGINSSFYQGLNVPTITLGVSGGDLTQLTEHVHVQMCQYLPAFVLKLTEALSKNPENSLEQSHTDDLQRHLEELEKQAESIAAATVTEIQTIEQQKQQQAGFYAEVTQGTLTPHSLDSFLKQRFTRQQQETPTDEQVTEDNADSEDHENKVTLQGAAPSVEITTAPAKQGQRPAQDRSTEQAPKSSTGKSESTATSDTAPKADAADTADATGTADAASTANAESNVTTGGQISATDTDTNNPLEVEMVSHDSEDSLEPVAADTDQSNRTAGTSSMPVSHLNSAHTEQGTPAHKKNKTARGKDSTDAKKQSTKNKKAKGKEKANRAAPEENAKQASSTEVTQEELTPTTISLQSVHGTSADAANLAYGGTIPVQRDVAENIDQSNAVLDSYVMHTSAVLSGSNSVLPAVEDSAAQSASAASASAEDAADESAVSSSKDKIVSHKDTTEKQIAQDSIPSPVEGNTPAAVALAAALAAQQQAEAKAMAAAQNHENVHAPEVERDRMIIAPILSGDGRGEPILEPTKVEVLTVDGPKGSATSTLFKSKAVSAFSKFFKRKDEAEDKAESKDDASKLQTKSSTTTTSAFVSTATMSAQEHTAQPELTTAVSAEQPVTTQDASAVSPNSTATIAATTSEHLADSDAANTAATVSAAANDASIASASATSSTSAATTSPASESAAPTAAQDDSEAEITAPAPVSASAAAAANAAKADTSAPVEDKSENKLESLTAALNPQNAINKIGSLFKIDIKGAFSKLQEHTKSAPHHSSHHHKKEPVFNPHAAVDNIDVTDPDDDQEPTLSAPNPQLVGDSAASTTASVSPAGDAASDAKPEIAAKDAAAAATKSSLDSLDSAPTTGNDQDNAVNEEALVSELDAIVAADMAASSDEATDRVIAALHSGTDSEHQQTVSANTPRPNAPWQDLLVAATAAITPQDKSAAATVAVSAGDAKNSNVSTSTSSAVSTRASASTAGVQNQSKANVAATDTKAEAISTSASANASAKSSNAAKSDNIDNAAEAKQVLADADLTAAKVNALITSSLKERLEQNQLATIGEPLKYQSGTMGLALADGVYATAISFGESFTAASGSSGAATSNDVERKASAAESKAADSAGTSTKASAVAASNDSKAQATAAPAVTKDQGAADATKNVTATAATTSEHSEATAETTAKADATAAAEAAAEAATEAADSKAELATTAESRGLERSSAAPTDSAAAQKESSATASASTVTTQAAQSAAMAQAAAAQDAAYARAAQDSAQSNEAQGLAIPSLDAVQRALAQVRPTQRTATVSFTTKDESELPSAAETRTEARTPVTEAQAPQAAAASDSKARLTTEQAIMDLAVGSVSCDNEATLERFDPAQAFVKMLFANDEEAAAAAKAAKAAQAEQEAKAAATQPSRREAEDSAAIASIMADYFEGDSNSGNTSNSSSSSEGAKPNAAMRQTSSRRSNVQESTAAPAQGAESLNAYTAHIRSRLNQLQSAEGATTTSAQANTNAQANVSTPSGASAQAQAKANASASAKVSVSAKAGTSANTKTTAGTATPTVKSSTASAQHTTRNSGTAAAISDLNERRAALRRAMYGEDHATVNAPRRTFQRQSEVAKHEKPNYSYGRYGADGDLNPAYGNAVVKKGARPQGTYIDLNEYGTATSYDPSQVSSAYGASAAAPDSGTTNTAPSSGTSSFYSPKREAAASGKGWGLDQRASAAGNKRGSGYTPSRQPFNSVFKSTSKSNGRTGPNLSAPPAASYKVNPLPEQDEAAASLAAMANENSNRNLRRHATRDSSGKFVSTRGQNKANNTAATNSTEMPEGGSAEALQPTPQPVLNPESTRVVQEGHKHQTIGIVPLQPDNAIPMESLSTSNSGVRIVRAKNAVTPSIAGTAANRQGEKVVYAQGGAMVISKRITADQASSLLNQRHEEAVESEPTQPTAIAGDLRTNAELSESTKRMRAEQEKLPTTIVVRGK